jgi:hypothetical protein
MMANCNKNEENNKNYLGTAYINDSIKSLVFNKGSYWIYISDSLDQIDSTYISDIKNGFYEIGYGLDTYQQYEYYAMNLVSNNLGSHSSHQLFIDRTHLLLNPIVSYPNAWGPILYDIKPINNPPEYKYLDSLNGAYYKFYHIQEYKNTPLWWHDTAFIYYTEPGIGIVKKVFTVDSVTTTWNLKRWKIVK